MNIDCLLLGGWLSLPGPDDFAFRKRKRRVTAYSPKVLWTRRDRPPKERSST